MAGQPPGSSTSRPPRHLRSICRSSAVMWPSQLTSAAEGQGMGSPAPRPSKMTTTSVVVTNELQSASPFVVTGSLGAGVRVGPAVTVPAGDGVGV